jgi:hypothetical protein
MASQSNEIDFKWDMSGLSKIGHHKVNVNSISAVCKMIGIPNPDKGDYALIMSRAFVAGNFGQMFTDIQKSKDLGLFTHCIGKKMMEDVRKKGVKSLPECLSLLD